MSVELSTISVKRLFENSEDQRKKSLSDGINVIYSGPSGVVRDLSQRRDSIIARLPLRQVGFESSFFESLSNKSALVRLRVPNVKIIRARVWFRNYSESDAIVTGAIVRGVPTKTSQTGGAWSSIPMIGGTTVSVPAKKAGEFQPTTHFFPGEACTDWFVPSTVARTDGGSDWLFDIVFRCGSNGIGGTLAPCDTAGWYNTNTDLVAAPPASVGLTMSYASTSAWIEVEYFCGTARKPIYVINGDSTFASTQTGFFGSYQLGVQTLGGESFTANIGGSTARTSHENLMEFLPFVNADYVATIMYSVNDAIKTGGQSPADAVTDSIDVIRTLQKMGHRVIPIGPMPANASSAKILEARTILKNSGMLFFDPCLTACDNPDASCTWKDGYSLDAYHPNETGRIAIGTAFSDWVTANSQYL